MLQDQLANLSNQVSSQNNNKQAQATDEDDYHVPMFGSQNTKKLKVAEKEVQPFTLEERQQLKRTYSESQKPEGGKDEEGIPVEELGVKVKNLTEFVDVKRMMHHKDEIKQVYKEKHQRHHRPREHG